MMTRPMRSCPHCGASLPEEASFCPYCATDIHPRTVLEAPRPKGKFLRLGLAAILALAAVLAGAVLLAPNTYDAYGEVFYTDRDGSYQLVLANAEDRYQPVPACHQRGVAGEQYRFPVHLYINHVGSGANAGQMFLQKVRSVSTEVVGPADGPSSITCSQPEPKDFAPHAALVSLVDYTGQDESAQLLWTIQMLNGDTIKLRQTIEIQLIEVIEYHYQDHPMDTIEALQALVNQITEEVPLPTQVRIYLPPVVYGGGLTVEGRPMDLYGSSDGTTRTTFTGTVRVAAQDGPILYFHDLDFAGSGEGVGVSASARFWAQGCRFTGWRTGVLGYGYAWVNVTDCWFEDNEVAFHFNSDDGSVSHTKFDGNTFLDNGTAVLLERVSTDVMLDFQGSRFSGNDTDIDNRCGQAIDISQAIFQ